MADNQQQDLFADAYAEAARRGLIPADLKSAAQAEAEKRGLVSKASAVDSAFSGFDDVIRSIARGATFGYADEIAAVMNSATRGGSYEENLAKEQARTAEVSPVTRVVGEITGAIGGTVATAPARAAAVAATGLSRVPGLVRAAAGGAAGGALYGSEEAGPGNRLSATTAEGAAIGAVAGPVGMAVARGVGRAVQAVSSPVKAAIADIQRALTRDEITPEHAQQLAQALGADRPAATLADVGGENVRGLMERVAQTPGAGRTQVVPFLTARQQEQTDRIANDLSQLTGTKQSAFNAINQTMQERSTQGKPLYDAAMNFNARADADVAKAWAEETSSGWGASILKSGTLRKNLQSEYGTKDIADAPLMVTIDAWKKVADDMGGPQSALAIRTPPARFPKLATPCLMS